jgi:hypothetical protein
MSLWEEKILAAFVQHYFASAPQTGEETRAVLRLRHALFFPGFDAAPPDEKEAYLEAAEALERRGLVTITWEKRGKGERVKTISCADFERLFVEGGGAYPQAEAEKIRALFAEKARRFRAAADGAAGAFLEYLARSFGVREIAQGIDRGAADDFIRLLELVGENAQPEKLSVRALSILLYRDSKRLETLRALVGPLVSRARKEGAPLPCLSFLDRSYPDTLIAGSVIFEHKEAALPPLINTSGLIIGFPQESVDAFRAVRPVAPGAARRALIIENKETFYALASPLKSPPPGQRAGEGALPTESARMERGRVTPASRKTGRVADAFLYSGGYPNQAAAAFIRLFAASGYCLSHAGDLDPDGILILQHICELAGQPVAPVMMSAAVFDRYLPWARPLGRGALRQLDKIHDGTRAIPGIAELIRRIEESCRGVEQECIDYRESF